MKHFQKTATIGRQGKELTERQQRLSFLKRKKVKFYTPQAAMYGKTSQHVTIGTIPMQPIKMLARDNRYLQLTQNIDNYLISYKLSGYYNPQKKNIYNS